MDKTSKKLQMNIPNPNDSKEISPEKKSFLNKLYLDPIESLNKKLSETKSRGFRIKTDVSKSNTEYSSAMPTTPSMYQTGGIPIPQVTSTRNNFNMNRTQGNVIMQNWETSKNIPKDIGEFIHFPVLVDRNKLKLGFDQVNKIKNLSYTTTPNFKFSKNKIRQDGEKLVKSLYTKEDNLALTMPTQTNYVSFPTNEDLKKNKEIIDKNLMTFQKPKTKDLTLVTNEEELSTEKQYNKNINMTMTMTIPQMPKLNIENKVSKLIDFSTFNKHLFLKDNDFLYAKRVGGPVDYILCSYQDINRKSKISGNTVPLKKKKLDPINPLNKKKVNTVEYITISKNTVLHYQRGVPVVYSIQEWIDNFNKYKLLMKIPLFKNFRNAKLFDSWRRFYRKTKRQYYTEKLKKNFFFVDKHLLHGILETRTALKAMNVYNIFDMKLVTSVLLNKFNELHKYNLVTTDRKINQFRTTVKNIITQACNNSYQEYKTLKKITLDDNTMVGTDEKNNSNDNNNNTNNNSNKDNKNKDSGVNIQNFIKNAIPYAQDATRKTHYKKLLRYIRVMDYIFNESKFFSIQFSLELLVKKFKRLYECFLNKWVDPPIIITKILCMGDKIYYNPSIRLIYEAIFDNFIQETIYTVIFKKNFIEPQEFPKYMSCYEEVFEISIDQNGNLNGRIKETEHINELFDSLKEHFELCHQELNKEVDKLRPILENYLKNSKISFTELEQNSTPNQLKELLSEFHEKEKIVKSIKPIINIGIFEFQLDDLLDMVSDAPRQWIEKMNKVIPKVLASKMRSSIERMSNHLVELSVNPSDVESFIKLKKAVEACNKEKQLHEDMSNDILDLQTVIDSNKEIKLQEYDNKLIIELKDISVKYDRKLDATSYFIDNNIAQFRVDLKNEITKFDDKIKGMMSELNNDILNTYNEDPFNAIDYLEENSLKIKKSLMMKEKYQIQEDDLELDETMKSNFENLDNLEYEQELKMNLWNSVKEFQDKTREWENEKVLKINLPEMKELIKKWLHLCEVAIVDIDIPHVPLELKKRVQIYEQLIPVIEAIQNQNILLVPHLLAILNDLIKVEIKEDHPMTVYEMKHIPDIFDKIPDIKELNFRANEEKRLHDLIKTVKESFYPRNIPILSSYNKPDFDREFEFVEENLQMLNKIYLNKYYGCVYEQLNKLTQEFNKYYKFLTHFIYYQKYIQKSAGIMENQDFMKTMQAEHKRLLNENQKKNFLNNWKDNRNIQKFLDHVYEKQMGILNYIIQSYEKEYKAISTFFNMKRNEIPKFYALNDNDINDIYREKESKEIKQKMIKKMYPWIKSINIGDDQDEFIKFITIDDEDIQIKYAKNRTLKELIEFLEMCLIRKLKDNFKSFKKEYETSIRAKSNKKPKEIIQELILNKDNLAQGIFNCMFYSSMDNLEKALAQPDEAFDKLFDLYNEIKDDRIVEFFNLIKSKDVSDIQRRILINLIFLLNYTKTIIENLIRDDVTSTNDFNYAKLIFPKIENDSFILHFLSFTLEYGYEYVGLQSNFLIMPESEKMYLSLAQAINYKKPFYLYGLNNETKKETIKIIANLCGKRINYFYATTYFDLESFNKIYLANKKTGCWLCIDECQNMKYDLLEILANRVADIYRIMQTTGIEEDDFTGSEEKSLIKLHVFFYRELSYNYDYNKESIPKIIKNYYRHIALPKMDYEFYLNQVLANFNWENHEEICNKILYILNYASNKMTIMKKKNLIMKFILQIIEDINKNILIIKKEECKLYIRNLIKEIFIHLLKEEENEDFRKILNEVFEMKDYKGDLPEEKNVNENEEEIIETEEEKAMNNAIKEIFNKYKIKSNYFEEQIKYLYSAIKNFDNFVLCGSPMSGKTTILNLLHEVSKFLYDNDRNKFFKILNLHLYPKSKKPYIYFAENKIERAYRFNNNFFYNMISMFDEDYKENLEKLNAHYSQFIGYKIFEEDEEFTPELLEKKFKTLEEEYQKEEENNNNNIYLKDKNNNEEDNIYKSLILDGQIDDTWIEYINNFYDKENFLALANGDKINFRNNFKLFFETMNLKNTPPSFLTKQIIIYCSQEKNRWESMLYNWIEVNKKISENPTLKNYIRGLFENYLPRIQDFIENNKIHSINISPNYILKTLITIFDSIFPMFNFEDVKIGRRNFNITPKIEIIKKCSLSIFIFSCAWTINLLSNFVIKQKIEKLISDIFKADDLKGPIFEYYIDETTNDFELWTNILKDPYYNTNFEKGAKFNYGNVFIHTQETIPYFWICSKLIDLNIAFYLNGKENSGKTFLVNTILEKKEEEELEIKKIKIMNSYNKSPEEVEEYIFKNITTIKRDLYGDQFLKQTCVFIDDLNMNMKKDKYETSNLLEFLREICQYKYVYDSKNNENRFLKKFALCCCGNLSGYPYNEEFNRFINNLILITFVTSDDYFISIFKPSLEFHLRQYIPNTSGITSNQYLQASMKLYNFIKKEIKQEPGKLHIMFGIRDVIKFIQSIHDFNFKQSNDYPDYLKKIFFYESTMVYESKLNKKNDKIIFRNKICEAYSSVFKQDKLTINDIYTPNWDNNNEYAFCTNFNNFNNDENVEGEHQNEEIKEIKKEKELCFINNKQILIEYIKSKIDIFYRAKDIKNKSYIKITEQNLLYVVQILKNFEQNNQNLILIGKEYTGKKNLFELACFLAEIDIIEIDNTYFFDTNKTLNHFIKEIITPFLINATHKNKRSILYIPSSVTIDYVKETVVKLLDYKEIINNFIFIDIQNYGEITEEETLERLSKNISICFDLIPKSKEYLNIFCDYSSIAKSSNIVYFHSWKKDDMVSFMSNNYKQIDINENIKNNLSDIFIQIFNYTNELYKMQSKSIGINIILNQKNFCDVFEFFVSKFSEYKNILIERQNKYNEAFTIIDKVKALMERANKDIEEANPKKAELDKFNDDQKKILGEKQKIKNAGRTKKQNLDKVVESLTTQLKDEQATLESILLPFEEAINKIINPLNRVNQNDMTEIKNTWDSFNLGKYIFTKICETLGEPCDSWDIIKKNLDVKIIKNLISSSPSKSKDKKKLMNLTKEITNNNDFISGGENKYNKPFKLCTILCEFFNACKNYYNELDKQKEIIEKINKLKEEIELNQQEIKKVIQEVNLIENDISEIDKIMIENDTKKHSINDHLLKLKAMNDCLSSFVTTANEKLIIWKNRKENMDIILQNFEFYLMIISFYIHFAPPLTYKERKKYKEYLYSFDKKLNLENIKKINIYSIFREVLDSSNKDNEFCASIGMYEEFLADNFTMMYIMKDKIPYILDNMHISPEIISTFLELKNPKVIVKTNYNGLNEQGEMFDKIESAMKTGSILFIEQCEEGIYNIMENLINDKFIYNAESGKNSYLIRGKKIIKNPKFKLYFIKSKPKSKINPKALENCYLINFKCPRYILKEYIYKSICKEQNPSLYQSVLKTNNKINKDQFRLFELEKNLLNYNKKIDLSYDLEKLEANQSLLDKYKIEALNHNSLLTEIKLDKIRLNIFKEQLRRYDAISNDGSMIYKLLYIFFDNDILYMLPINYISDLIKEFFRKKFDLEKNLIKKKGKNDKKNKKEEENNDDIDEQDNEGDNDNDNEQENEGDEEEKEKDEQQMLEEELETLKKNKDEFPTYKVDNAPELVIFLYNKLEQIYDINTKKYILLLLLFFAMKQKDEIPSKFKKIIINIQSIFFEKKLDKENYNFKSPINKIDDFTWSCLRQINDCSSYIFAILIDHIENHKQEWETFLEDDEILIETKFRLIDEDLSSTVNPFTKFTFFSIIKSHLSDTLISSTIKDILYNEDNSFIINNKENEINYEENNNEIVLEKTKTLSEVFFKNINIERKPIIIIDKQDGEIAYQKEIKEYYIKKLKHSINRERDREEGKENNIILNDSVNLKEINPNKMEFTNTEMDLIHSSMKNGGIIFIKNCNLVKDSILKLIEDIRDSNMALNENFKLILYMDNNHIFPSYLYSSCNIINRDILLLTQMKDYMLDLIQETPIEIFNSFMNSPNNNISAYYVKKLYIFFTIVYCILFEYDYLGSKIIKIPINYTRKEYYMCLEYILDIINSIPEEKQKELQNLDNIFGFTYESVIKIINDTFIYSKLITKKDTNNIEKFLQNIFENSSFIKNDILFTYDDFILTNINEKLYPINNEITNTENEANSNSNNNLNNLTQKYCIPKSALIEQLENIPNEIYYNLLYGVSKFICDKETKKIINNFYERVSHLGNNIDQNIHHIPATKININKILEKISEFKKLLPDMLNTTEANNVLFKVNKYNELFNPLDECLTEEINNYNNFLSLLYNDMANIVSIIDGNMFLISEYQEIINDLNNDKVPKKWSLSKYGKSNYNTINSWLERIKYIFSEFNKWITDGYLNVYDLSIFSNEKLFMTLLPLYFQKKLSEKKAKIITSDKINLNFKLTKIEPNEEITDEKIKEYSRTNFGNDFIFIKGFKLPGFKGHQENPRDIKSYHELDENEINNNNNIELIPVIVVSYTVKEFQIDTKVVKGEVKSENEDEDSEEEENEDEKQSLTSLTKKLKNDVKIGKKLEKLEIKSMDENKKVEIQATKEVNVVHKTKVKYYKKHCRLEIPFEEENLEGIYDINEPFGYVEIKFDCDKYRQEEYFINKDIKLILDK